MLEALLAAHRGSAGGADRTHPRTGPDPDHQSAGRRLTSLCAALRRTARATAALRSNTCAPKGRSATASAIPRPNLIARLTGACPARCVHFNGISMSSSRGRLDAGSVRRRGEGRRIYGRGACDMKGGMAAAMFALEAIIDTGIRFPGAFEISGTVDEEIGRLRRRRLSRRAGLFLAAARRPRHHPRTAQRRPHLRRPSRRLVERSRDHRPDRARLDAVSRRLRHRHMAAPAPDRNEALPRSRRARPPAGRADGGPALDAQHQRRPWRPARAEEGYAVCPAPVVAHSCRRCSTAGSWSKSDRRVKARDRRLLDDLKRSGKGFDYRSGRMEFLPTFTRDAPVVRPSSAARSRPRPRTYRLAGHLRPEAHRSDRPPAGLHRIWPRHPRPRPSAGRYVGSTTWSHSAKVMAAATLRLLGVEHA